MRLPTCVCGTRRRTDTTEPKLLRHSGEDIFLLGMTPPSNKLFNLLTVLLEGVESMCEKRESLVAVNKNQTKHTKSRSISAFFGAKGP